MLMDEYKQQNARLYKEANQIFGSCWTIY